MPPAGARPRRHWRGIWPTSPSTLGGWPSGRRGRDRARCSSWRWRRGRPSAGGPATGSADRLALWTSYRIGAAEEDGDGLIRTAWAARRLAGTLATALGEEGRADPGLIADVAAGLEPLAGCSAVTQGAAVFHLWRSLDERPDHCAGWRPPSLARGSRGRGGLPFLPLALTGAVTASGNPESRLAKWISIAHRAVLAALMTLDWLAQWRARAEAETADISGRTPLRLIAALAAHPMLAAPQAEAATSASRAAVQRNLDLLQARGVVREVAGHGRFGVWAARLCDVECRRWLSSPCRQRASIRNADRSRLAVHRSVLDISSVLLPETEGIEEYADPTSTNLRRHHRVPGRQPTPGKSKSLAIDPHLEPPDGTKGRSYSADLLAWEHTKGKNVPGWREISLNCISFPDPARSGTYDHCFALVRKHKSHTRHP